MRETANLKESEGGGGGGVYRDVWVYIENPFLYFRQHLPPTTGTGFDYALQEL